MRKWHRFLPLILILIFSPVLWIALNHNPNNQDNATLGRRLPDSQAENILQSGQKIALSSLKGKPFILNIWASWCPNCRAEHAFLMEISSKYTLYGITYRDRPEAAKQWLAQQGNPFQIVLDDQKGNLSIDLGVYGTPETLLFDAEGILRARYTGLLTRDVWNSIFVPHLKTVLQQVENQP